MHKKFNILLVSEYYPPKIFGGGEKSVALLAESLAKAGHEVTVLTSWHPGLARQEIHNNVQIARAFRTGPDNKTLWHNFLRTIPFHRSTEKAVLKFLQKKSINVIHVFNVTAIVGTMNAVQQLRKMGEKSIPKIITTLNCHNAYCPLGTRLTPSGEVFKGIYNFKTFWKFYRNDRQIGKLSNRWWLRWNLLLAIFIYWNFWRTREATNDADSILAVSRAVKEIADRHTNPKKVNVVHNIFDAASIEKKIHLPHGMKKAEKSIVFYLGPLTAIKGIDTVLRSLKILIQKKRHLKLWIGGEGPDRTFLEKIARHEGVENHIKWLGAIDPKDINEYYASADVFVQPSRIPEPLSRTLLEAVSRNVPIVASNRGGSLDVIRNGANGFLYEAGNANDLARNILNVLEGKLASQRLRETNEEILETFKADHVVSQLEGIYQSLFKMPEIRQMPIKKNSRALRALDALKDRRMPHFLLSQMVLRIIRGHRIQKSFQTCASVWDSNTNFESKHDNAAGGRPRVFNFKPTLYFAFTIDVEQNFGSSWHRHGTSNPSHSNLDVFYRDFLPFAEKESLKATLFIQGDSLLESARDIERAFKKGHEVGLHGYHHELWGGPRWFSKEHVISEDEQRILLKKALQYFDQIGLKSPRSFRAPNLVIQKSTYRLLSEAGFLVDSSTPVFDGKNLLPHRVEKIQVIPLSADPLPEFTFHKKIPITTHWVFNMHNLRHTSPERFWKALNRWIAFQKSHHFPAHAVFLIHSWEFDQDSREKKDEGYRRLRQLFDELKTRYEVEFMTLEQLANRMHGKI